MRILITGASGCVGQYIVEELLENSDYELVLLLRDRAKLPLQESNRSRVEFVECDLRDAASQEAALHNVDAAILLATAWGGGDTFDITVHANVALAERLVALGCRRILYFATASVLTRSSALSVDARDLGTEYIRAKYALVEELEKHCAAASITGLFPTLVLGGRTQTPAKPLSHFARLLIQVDRWMWAGRFFSAPGRFHIIHARDIAAIVHHLLARDVSGMPAPERIVLGNPARTVDELLADFCRYKGQPVRPLIRLSPRLADYLIRILRIQLSPWDRHCMDHPDQSYAEAKDPKSFGLVCHAPALADGLEDVGIRPRS